ncbi:hypothetical protein GCWU000282_01839 [Catonella morbi ATCC 51271]|uniref:Uncharacterized protein n=1 Tax=Catonella morbi ATCC 51271 TaxID=592026 RepID=V2Y1W2_9FIRM|nr:hypothetical protein GCWU000282_01839 [Catonella morbi ATCC 51271]
MKTVSVLYAEFDSSRNKKKTPIGDENAVFKGCRKLSYYRNKKKTPIGDENNIFQHIFDNIH